MGDEMFTNSVVELIDSMGDDRRACHAARVSFLKDGEAPGEEMTAPLNKRDKRLIEFLMREKHTSPFEHSVITFRVTAPLPIVAQIMRHRTFSYNQASRRYTSESIQFFDVMEWRKQGTGNLQCSDGSLGERSADLNSAYRLLCMDAMKLYDSAVEAGCSREQARFILPQGMMATFWMTGNLHNYLKFLILRDDDHAQEECQEVAALIRVNLEAIFPETMALFAENRVRKSAKEDN